MRNINSFYLKCIAVITMLIDHIGAIFMGDSKYYELFRIIGRLAFPIFCFLLVEGYFHTRDVKKYLLRLGIFALLSEIPFDLALNRKLWDPSFQNVYFTLMLGLAAVWAVDTVRKRLKSLPAMLCNLAAIYVTSFLALILHTDYDAGGVLLILIFFLFREQKIILMAVVFAVLTFWFGGIETYGALALVFIVLYNGEKGKSMKYVFYAFYPIHLLLLFLIGQYQFLIK